MARSAKQYLDEVIRIGKESIMLEGFDPEKYDIEALYKMFYNKVGQYYADKEEALDAFGDWIMHYVHGI